MWEFGVSRCKLLYRLWIKIKIQLYSTGKYIQYPLTITEKKIQKRKNRCNGFLGGSVFKKKKKRNLTASAGAAEVLGDMHSVPGSERSPGGGNSSPFQCSCMGNSMDRGTWWATVPGVTKNRTQLSD